MARGWRIKLAGRDSAIVAGHTSACDKVVVYLLSRGPARETGVACFAGISGPDVFRRLASRQFGVMARETIVCDVGGDVVKGRALPGGR